MRAELRVGPQVWEEATGAGPAAWGAETEAWAVAEADPAMAAGVATPEELRTEPATAAPAVQK